MTSPVLELDTVTRHYVTKGETVRALDGVSLSVAPGEFVAVAGPSGSGKSTLLNLAGALDTPTSGRVLVEGRDLSGLSSTELSDLRRDRLGFVFQAYNLIPVLSVLENVEYVMMIEGMAKAPRQERARSVLESLGLVGMLSRRPNELSGGQQQRVAVARALASRPAIILADEPTANLDSHTGEELIELMSRINREEGTTFIFSTHDEKVMSSASRLVHVRDGKIESDVRQAA
jgi:putative ABC transport system ATP-binding protein